MFYFVNNNFTALSVIRLLAHTSPFSRSSLFVRVFAELRHILSPSPWFFDRCARFHTVSKATQLSNGTATAVNTILVKILQLRCLRRAERHDAGSGRPDNLLGLGACMSSQTRSRCLYTSVRVNTAWMRCEEEEERNKRANEAPGERGSVDRLYYVRSTEVDGFQ